MFFSLSVHRGGFLLPGPGGPHPRSEGGSPSYIQGSPSQVWGFPLPGPGDLPPRSGGGGNQTPCTPWGGGGGGHAGGLSCLDIGTDASDIGRYLDKTM